MKMAWRRHSYALRQRPPALELPRCRKALHRSDFLPHFHRIVVGPPVLLERTYLGLPISGTSTQVGLVQLYSNNLRLGF
jgi:hypothetical protein